MIVPGPAAFSALERMWTRYAHSEFLRMTLLWNTRSGSNSRGNGQTIALAPSVEATLERFG
jgi:hypothetical protein